MFWLGALTWAGSRVGSPIAGVPGNAVGDVRSAGEHISAATLPYVILFQTK
ncbi:hypothetical protein C3043_003648 [Salmonella enterica]|nr:hypothetical protein [Salmonella enterica]EDW8959335.1 hypothetical protein [Salmonella enterica subsp. enterica]EEJ3913654.1 hypothetical protein [Salmonella enterica subsp. enterica serovar Waral]